MSTLTLVRHGQARPFERQTDRLSVLGAEQARTLASHWLASGETFDEVWTGTLERQQQTERIVAGCFRAAGVHWPGAQASSGWNEYDAHGVLSRLVPAFAIGNAQFAGLVRAFEEARGTADQNRHFQRMFEIAMALWLDGVMDVDGVEPFRVFEERVSAMLRQATSTSGSRRVAVFTSGGPIGLAVQRVLDAPARSFLNIHWRVRNCSLTEFVFGGGKISLDGFNSVGHLPRDQWSFR